MINKLAKGLLIAFYGMLFIAVLVVPIYYLAKDSQEKNKMKEVGTREITYIGQYITRSGGSGSIYVPTDSTHYYFVFSFLSNEGEKTLAKTRVSQALYHNNPYKDIDNPISATFYQNDFNDIKMKIDTTEYYLSDYDPQYTGVITEQDFKDLLYIPQDLD